MKSKHDGPDRELSLLDSTSLIVGIIVGVGIYQMAPSIARSVGSWWGVLLIWLAGGLLSLCGALNYSELAAAYPRQGGDYVYLSRAYGPWAGFLFGWVQLAIVRPGDIAVMAFAFAMYARTIMDPLAGTAFPYTLRVYACVAVAVMTLINVLGVRAGKRTQNLLTAVKAAGLLAIVIAAVVAPPAAKAEASAPGALPLSLGLIFVLFTFGGWNEMAYVAAEVKDHKRNVVRAMVLGMATVTTLYLLVNGAFLYALGFEGVAASEAVAADTVSTVFPLVGARLISVLICISSLGALNGLILTGSRISYAIGADYRGLRWLGRWSNRRGAPVPALLLQGLIAIVLIVALGAFIDTVIYTAAPVYMFYLATSLAVVVLRRKEPGVERPYRVTAYPLPTVVFSAVCAFLVYKAFTYAWATKPWIIPSVVVVMALGLSLYAVARRKATIDRKR